MIWTYLANSNSISPLTPNPLTFECVEFEASNKELLDKLTDGYIELMNEGFFDGFSNDYNILFVSSYSPSESPITREKLFVIEFNKQVNKFNKNN
jgi:hypothetical protein